jgi:hypothetical protein
LRSVSTLIDTDTPSRILQRMNEYSRPNIVWGFGQRVGRLNNGHIYSFWQDRCLIILYLVKGIVF